METSGRDLRGKVAAFIASLMLTTEALVSEIPGKTRDAPAGGGGGMGGMY
jgi:chaperonin GroEL